MGVMPYFGTKIDRWEWAVGFDPDIMINVSTKWGDERNRVCFKVRNVEE